MEMSLRDEMPESFGTKEIDTVRFANEFDGGPGPCWVTRGMLPVNREGFGLMTQNTRGTAMKGISTAKFEDSD